jgi:hypothetical protein
MNQSNPTVAHGKNNITIEYSTEHFRLLSVHKILTCSEKNGLSKRLGMGMVGGVQWWWCAVAGGWAAMAARDAFARRLAQDEGTIVPCLRILLNCR